MEKVVIKKTTFNLKDEKDYFIRFIEALSNVDESYLKYETYKFEGELLVPVIKRAERVFAYELYHQYRLIMPNAPYYVLNAEVFKDNKIFQSEDIQSCYPDLVLHRDIGHIDEGTQYFLCEIKMSSNSQLVNDLSKLTKLAKFTNLSFEYYIFLCIGLDEDGLRNIILKKCEQKPSLKFSGDVMCVCRKEEQIAVFRLNEILPQKLLL